MRTRACAESVSSSPWRGAMIKCRDAVCVFMCVCVSVLCMCGISTRRQRCGWSICGCDCLLACACVCVCSVESLCLCYIAVYRKGVGGRGWGGVRLAEDASRQSVSVSFTRTIRSISRSHKFAANIPHGAFAARAGFVGISTRTQSDMTHSRVSHTYYI